MFSELHREPNQRCSPPCPPPDVCYAPLVHLVPVSPLVHLRPRVSVDRTLGVATVVHREITGDSDHTDVPCLRDCRAIWITGDKCVKGHRSTGIVQSTRGTHSRSEGNQDLKAVTPIVDFLT